MLRTRILAAVSRFPEDDAVLARGRSIAALHGAGLTVVHVIDVSRHSASPALMDRFLEQAEIAAHDRIDAALRRQGIDRASAEVIVESGSPIRKLAEIHGYLTPALMVMGDHQYSWISERLSGSTTESAIAAGIAPLLVVRNAGGSPYDRVLLATGGPENALAAHSFVSALLPRTDLHLVQAVQVAPQLKRAMLRIGLAQSDLLAHHEALAEEAERRLRSLTANLGPPVTWQVERGDPATEVSRVARDGGFDLIALGPKRSRRLRRAFVGSVARRLLRDTDCDLLISGPVARWLSRAPVTGIVHAKPSTSDFPDFHPVGDCNDRHPETKPADPRPSGHDPQLRTGA